MDEAAGSDSKENATSLKVIDGRRNTEYKAILSAAVMQSISCVADIDNDGSSEIIVTGSTGNGNRVNIFSSNPKGQWHRDVKFGTALDIMW